MDGVPCDKCAPGGPGAAAATARSWAVRQALWRRRPHPVPGQPEHWRFAYDHKASRLAPGCHPCTGGPGDRLACIVWATAPRSVSSTPSTSCDGGQGDKDKCTGPRCRHNICPASHHDRRQHRASLSLCAPTRIRRVATSSAPPASTGPWWQVSALVSRRHPCR